MSREDLARSIASSTVRRIMEDVLYMAPPDLRPTVEERLRSPILTSLLLFGLLVCAERDGVLVHANETNPPL